MANIYDLARDLIDRAILAKDDGRVKVTLDDAAILRSVTELVRDRLVIETRLRDLSFAVEGLFLSYDRSGQGLIFGWEDEGRRNQLRELARNARVIA